MFRSIRTGALEKFLSTPPSRVATCVGGGYPDHGAVSIHATLAGGDGQDINKLADVIVSIHATLAGGDASIVKLA